MTKKCPCMRKKKEKRKIIGGRGPGSDDSDFPNVGGKFLICIITLL